MFSFLNQSHEESLRIALDLDAPAGPTFRAELVSALQACRVEVVTALKTEEQSDRRKNLRSLYEGLTVASEFLAQHGADRAPSNPIASLLDQSVPPERGK